MTVSDLVASMGHSALRGPEATRRQEEGEQEGKVR